MARDGHHHSLWGQASRGFREMPSSPSPAGPCRLPRPWADRPDDQPSWAKRQSEAGLGPPGVQRDSAAPSPKPRMGSKQGDSAESPQSPTHAASCHLHLRCLTSRRTFPVTLRTEDEMASPWVEVGRATGPATDWHSEAAVAVVSDTLTAPIK